MITALLISTYNWPKALQLVLESILNQKKMPDEILIADDGSQNETRSLIEKFKKKYQLPITHVWQLDEGFQKSKILNKAIAISKADYIIQVDGDCILHSTFVADHLRHAKKGIFLYGSRVNLKKGALDVLYEQQKVQFNFFYSHLKNRTRNIHSNILSKFYKASPTLSSKLRGCNFSFWREDFLKVNGYNEAISGWGKEDSEFAIRLLNTGIIGKRIRYNAIVYHIWHPEECRNKVKTNENLENKTKEKRLTKCEKGVSRYLY
ncbi:glycosyltransferase family 2 protein [Zunongwangia sp.]|uniref:glycosyltransferase family 2 protein n=1 Tax=Zunongwangia sp. TaxID=1965325 RepID=UPI003AA89E91